MNYVQRAIESAERFAKEMYAGKDAGCRLAFEVGLLRGIVRDLANANPTISTNRVLQELINFCEQQTQVLEKLK